MNKPILGVIVFLSILFIACEQQKVKRIKYPDGSLKEEYEVTKDEHGQLLRNGLTKKFHKNGQLHVEVQFIEDKKHGRQRSFNANGKLEYEEFYLHGKLEGTRKQYFPEEGTVELQVDFKNNQRHGQFIRYRKDGQIHHQMQYVEGLKNGYHKQFNTDGSLDTLMWFEKGNPVDHPVDTVGASTASTGN